MADKSDTPDTPEKNNDEHESIVRHELDAAVNSLKKRIENLKGVDVSIPKKPNPFRNNDRKSF
jgi:hypothetical protein